MLASATRMPNAEPNVTPMIDVLLVLLIVFMTIVVRVHHTMDVQLPTPCAGTCAGAASIVLEVAPGPTYLINRTEVTPSELDARLRAIYLGRPEKVIQIAGHSGVRYAEIMSAMDIAKGAGVRVISISPKATQMP